MFTKILFFLVVFFTPGPIYAANTFVVDKNNIGGNSCNDSWPGTLTQPFCTITKGVTVIQPGDTLHIRAGTYPSFTSTKSGTVTAPITIASYPGERAIINGGQDGILLKGTSYVTLSGFEVKGATGNWLGGIRLTNNNSVYPMHNTIENNLVHDNVGTNTYGIVAEYASYTIIKNNTAYNNYQSGISIVQIASVDPGYDLIGNQIIGNTSYGNVLGGGDTDGIKTDGPRIKQTLIKDNISYGNGDDGIDVWNTSSSTLINNSSYNNRGTGDGNGFKLGGPGGGNNLIIGNISYGNKFNGFDSNGAGGNRYFHNTAYHNDSYGFEDGWKANGCTISSCKTTYINNIGYNNSRGNLSASIYTYSSHNNLWYSDSAGANVLFDYTPYSSLASFYTVSGNRIDNPNAGTLSSLSANPLLNTDFSLQSNSPAINRGDPANPANIIAVGIPDIGAKEYVAALLPTPTIATYFRMEVPPYQDQFTIKLTDPTKIQHARNLLTNQSGSPHVIGTVVQNTASYNAPWNFHLDPASINFFSSAIEICDASIRYIADHLGQYCTQYGANQCQWCPWSSRLVREVQNPTIVPADATGDGQVNELDFLIWKQKAFQAVSGAYNADVEGNGRVDGRDLVLWLTEYGQ